MGIRNINELPPMERKGLTIGDENKVTKQVAFRMLESDFYKMKEHFKKEGHLSYSEGIRKILINHLKDKGVI